MAPLFPLALCLLFPDVVDALKIERVRVPGDDVPYGFRTTSFEVNDVCWDGGEMFTEGSLALKKAGLRGALYNTTYASNYAWGISCEDRGFYNGEADPSYPGVTMYFKNGAARAAFAEKEDAALKAFQTTWNLDDKTVALMDACSSHENSTTRAKVASHCSSLNSIQSSFGWHSPETGRELVCNGGPFELALLALAATKSTALLPMHQNDQIRPVGCDQREFPHMDQNSDDCFTGLHKWTRTVPLESDAGYQEYRNVSIGMFVEGKFHDFFYDADINEEFLTGIPTCHCSPSSMVGRMNSAESCTHLPNSIRAWSDPYPTDRD